MTGNFAEQAHGLDALIARQHAKDQNPNKKFSMCYGHCLAQVMLGVI